MVDSSFAIYIYILEIIISSISLLGSFFNIFCYLYFKSIQAICESFEKSNYKKELLNQIALNANRRKYKEDNKIDRIQR